MTEYTLFDTHDSLESSYEWQKSEGVAEEDISETQAWENVREDWDLAMSNLDIDINGVVVVVADLGLWNGRKDGFSMTKESNIKDAIESIRFDGDYRSIIVDDDELVVLDSHHDGTNRLTLRVIDDGKYDYDDLYETVWSREKLMAETIGLGQIVRKKMGLDATPLQS